MCLVDLFCKSKSFIYYCLHLQYIYFHRNGYSLEIALLLSVFLGMFGLDRFYLGYPGIGLAKLCTLGFMFLGQLLDIILIASQVWILYLVISVKSYI